MEEGHGARLHRSTAAFQPATLNEIIAFAPLVVLALVMGIYPGFFLGPMEASINNLLVQIGAGTTRLVLQ